MACAQQSPSRLPPPHLCTSGGREDLACAGPPARTFAVRFAVGLAPPQPGARAICECRGARARPHTPRDVSVPSGPCAPRVCWRAGLRRVWRFGVCGMSSSSTQFRPVLTSSGQFGRVCEKLWRVPGSVCECSRVPRVRHSSCRVIQVFFKFSLRTRVDRSGCEIWLDPQLESSKFLKAESAPLSQSCVCARCALSRCFMLLATLESSWLLSAHQPATGRQSHRPASRERPDSTDRVSCRCLLLAPL